MGPVLWPKVKRAPKTSFCLVKMFLGGTLVPERHSPHVLLESDTPHKTSNTHKEPGPIFAQKSNASRKRVFVRLGVYASANSVPERHSPHSTRK